MSDRFYYLAYGSNLHPVRLSERVGSLECLGKIRLPGWRLCFDKRGSDGSAKANLRAAPGSAHEAWGALFRLQRGQYGTLDYFEGCGRGYETFWLDLTFGQQEIEVLTYLTPSHWRVDQGIAHDWYRDLVYLGARYHGIPEPVQQEIAAVPAAPDPDPDRAERHRQLIERLKQQPRSPA